ncbi:ribonuclease T [Vibrio pectenicida]|uniref:Ribonuclease T n=1 Tax=Vibrio pectenicida TaxID=62763 RepID=A0A3R9EA42_9VIBR|nr:ribonuclease T [Vibrio pectenicida]
MYFEVFNVKKLILFSLLFSFATFSYAIDEFEVSVENAPSGVYDISVISMTWMPTFCEFISKDKNICNNEFKLHGIWPYYTSVEDKDNIINYHPSNCFKSKGCSSTKDCEITADTISFLSKDKDMQKIYHKNLNLWSHEWRKHGTCSGLNQKEYFEQANIYIPKVLESYKNIEKLIMENKNSLVDVEEIYNVSPRNVSLRCLHVDGRNYLFEVNFFFDKSGKALNKVSSQIGDKCSGSIDLRWLN